MVHHDWKILNSQSVNLNNAMVYVIFSISGVYVRIVMATVSFCIFCLSIVEV